MIRTQQIAAALAQRHHVTILDGGRELDFPPKLHKIQVPRITRRDGELISLNPNLSLGQALQLRSEGLQQLLATDRPDVILVEHFPFSKWELSSEIDALLQSARHSNPSVKVICSLRDIAPRTRHEAPGNYEQTVVERLNQQFDALLVHADPRLCSLANFFPACSEITIPVYHTGIVAPTSAAPRPEPQPKLPLGNGYVIASIGGGADDAMLLDRVTRAWRRLKAEQALGSLVLLLFGGLTSPSETTEARRDDGDSIYHMGFNRHFRYWLQGAELSISCAGYNTCANLLVAGTPALLLPNLKMSDQLERARLMVQHGVATLVPQGTDSSDSLPQLILETLAISSEPHSIDVNGARNSTGYIEQLVSGSQVQ